jgi:hypothetical protein
VRDVWVRAVTRPRLRTYEALLEEAEDPSLGAAVKAMAAAGFTAAIISGFWLLAMVPAPSSGGVLAVVGLSIYVVESLVRLLIAFLMNTIISLAVSKALKGQGDLAAQSYLLSVSAAPMAILGSVLVMVPVMGSGLWWAASIYSRYLQLLGLRAAHKYGWGRGVVVLVVLALCWFVVGKCLEIAFGPLT